MWMSQVDLDFRIICKIECEWSGETDTEWYSYIESSSPMREQLFLNWGAEGKKGVSHIFFARNIALKE